MKEVYLYQVLEENKVRCKVCNHFCVINEGKRGICKVRVNKGGKLYTLVYGRLIAENVDPIEKKPFYHFLPESFAFSIATVGCNFVCPFCQNYDISQLWEEKNIIGVIEETPQDVVKKAISYKCQSISYTYTEPTVFFEFAYDTAKIAKEKGLKNNFVTNGYMSKEALKMISPYLDAANVDLKGDEEFYRKLCKAKRNPVIENIKMMKELGIWVEVTTLLIPDYNDSEEQISQIAKIIKEIDPSIPWHISRFFPHFKMSDHFPTPVEKIKRAREIGFEEGLKYVYTGNIPGDDGENTYCSSCKKLLIRRFGYNILENNIINGKCKFCGEKIDGVF